VWRNEAASPRLLYWIYGRDGVGVIFELDLTQKDNMTDNKHIENSTFEKEFL